MQHRPIVSMRILPSPALSLCLSVPLLALAACGGGASSPAGSSGADGMSLSKMPISRGPSGVSTRPPSSGSSTSSPSSVSGLWTWVNGSNIEGLGGGFVSKGVPGAGNSPTARNSAASWVDSSGTFWLFGGNNLFDTNPLDDLWSYSPASGLWTWVGGMPDASGGVYGTIGQASAANSPGARQNASTWIDSAGNLWLFGGDGYDSSGGLASGGTSGYLNDLWKYSPTTQKWTWVCGANVRGVSGVYGTQGTASAGNAPGARSDASSWIDASGNLWLFGGLTLNASQASVLFNDLWMFSPSTGQWTWVSGANVPGASGVYGTQGTASAGNVPGARSDASSWIDTAGNLWLFGGFGVVNSGGDSGGGAFNDLWKYSPATGQWTWVSGSNASAATSVYGAQGTAVAGNIPGARGSAASWIDSSGNLWLFGGDGLDSNGTAGLLNDLWQYNLRAGQWIWVSGSNLAWTSGVYGTLGLASSSNVPGARDFTSSWIDSAGSLWLFGGDNYNWSTTPLTGGDFSDVWRWTPTQ